MDIGTKKFNIFVIFLIFFIVLPTSTLKSELPVTTIATKFLPNFESALVDNITGPTGSKILLPSLSEMLLYGMSTAFLNHALSRFNQDLLHGHMQRLAPYNLNRGLVVFNAFRKLTGYYDVKTTWRPDPRSIDPSNSRYWDDNLMKTVSMLERDTAGCSDFDSRILGSIIFSDRESQMRLLLWDRINAIMEQAPPGEIGNPYSVLSKYPVVFDEGKFGNGSTKFPKRFIEDTLTANRGFSIDVSEILSSPNPKNTPRAMVNELVREEHASEFDEIARQRRILPQKFSSTDESISRATQKLDVKESDLDTEIEERINAILENDGELKFYLSKYVLKTKIKNLAKGREIFSQYYFYLIRKLLFQIEDEYSFLFVTEGPIKTYNVENYINLLEGLGDFFEYLLQLSIFSNDPRFGSKMTVAQIGSILRGIFNDSDAFPTGDYTQKANNHLNKLDLYLYQLALRFKSEFWKDPKIRQIYIQLYKDIQLLRFAASLSTDFPLQDILSLNPEEIAASDDDSLQIMTRFEMRSQFAQMGTGGPHFPLSSMRRLNGNGGSH